jgi:hypothetical protein
MEQKEQREGLLNTNPEKAGINPSMYLIAILVLKVT